MNLQFTFLCAGIPQPEYRWVKDGQYLGDFTTDHFYKIQHAKRSDAGDYQCIARNDAGAIHSEKIRVTVACKLEFIKPYHKHYTSFLVWRVRTSFKIFIRVQFCREL
jgi:hypothetical protein